MVLKKKVETQQNLIDKKGRLKITYKALPAGDVTIEARLEELESRPRRPPVVHWIGFALSLAALILLAVWVFSSRGPVPTGWVWFDVGLGIFTLVEFFTRSGFRWNWGTYSRSRFFDFIAIVPALALVNHGFAIESVWVWIILTARFVRVIDRLLGDGFVQRNIWALVEGFEEEITDRVLQNIVTRLQADMDRAHFTHGIAEVFVKNKSAVLQRVRAATPHDGFVPSLAHIVKLDAALERAEERTYDAVVQIIDSEEVDRAVRDAVNSVFNGMNSGLRGKSWKHKLGIRHHQVK